MIKTTSHDHYIVEKEKNRRFYLYKNTLYYKIICSHDGGGNRKRDKLVAKFIQKKSLFWYLYALEKNQKQ